MSEQLMCPEDKKKVDCGQRPHVISSVMLLTKNVSDKQV
jgi:hypothetical protein